MPDTVIPVTYFNSRPHGGRPGSLLGSRTACNFNSRPHGGRLSMHVKILINEEISTHALTEGDISRPESSEDVAAISTHALTEGDCVPYMEPFCKLISTHALTEGDFRIAHYFPPISISTHALTEGDRLRRS